MLQELQASGTGEWHSGNVRDVIAASVRPISNTRPRVGYEDKIPAVSSSQVFTATSIFVESAITFAVNAVI
jgi:hypothetical protein